MKSNIKNFLSPLFLTILFAATSLAQTGPVANPITSPVAAEVSTLKLESKLMAREMPYRIILPADYKSKTQARFPVIYLLHGLTGHHTNWTDRTAVAQYAVNHDFIIVMPEGDNGWYVDSVSKSTDKYESYIVKELIPEIDRLYRTSAARDHRMIAGLSMGGYGSLKFGLKYPEMFSLVGSFSGALGAASYTEKTIGAIGKGVDLVLGPDNSDARGANNIFLLVRELTPEKQKAIPFIYLSCGTEDFLFENNRSFLALLSEKKIPREYREHPGGHDWKFWDDQVREFLSLASRRLKK